MTSLADRKIVRAVWPPLAYAVYVQLYIRTTVYLAEEYVVTAAVG